MVLAGKSLLGTSCRYPELPALNNDWAVFSLDPKVSTPSSRQPLQHGCALTNEGNRRPGAGAKRRTRGVRVDQEVRQHVLLVGEALTCRRTALVIPQGVARATAKGKAQTLSRAFGARHALTRLPPNQNAQARARAVFHRGDRSIAPRQNSRSGNRGTRTRGSSRRRLSLVYHTLGRSSLWEKNP